MKVLAKRTKLATTSKRTKSVLIYACLDYGISVSGSKGASVHVRSISSALQQAGFDVHVDACRIGDGPLPAVAGLRELEGHPGLRSLQRQLRDYYGPALKIPAEMRQAAANLHLEPHLVQRWRELKAVAVVERLSLLGVAGVRAAQKLGIPHLLEVNALMADEARDFRGLSGYDLAVDAEREAFEKTTRIFCVSSVLRGLLLERGVPADKIEVLPNGFDSRLFRPRTAKLIRRRLGLERKFTVGTVGSLKPWHGIKLLLESFRVFASRHPSASLLVVGDGPESDTIREYTRRHPELSIVHAGSVPHDQVPSYLAAMDIVVAPYDVNGPFYFSPMKIVEYMAMGRPVIASDIGQISEIINHDKSGILVRPGSIRGFAAAYERLFRSAPLRRRLGGAARAAAAGRSWLANARAIGSAIEAERQ